jgi:hypothetical protein
MTVASAVRWEAEEAVSVSTARPPSQRTSSKQQKKKSCSPTMRRLGVAERAKNCSRRASELPGGTPAAVPRSRSRRATFTLPPARVGEWHGARLSSIFSVAFFGSSPPSAFSFRLVARSIGHAVHVNCCLLGLAATHDNATCRASVMVSNGASSPSAGQRGHAASAARRMTFLHDCGSRRTKTREQRFHDDRHQHANRKAARAMLMSRGWQGRSVIRLLVAAWWPLCGS